MCPFKSFDHFAALFVVTHFNSWLVDKSFEFVKKAQGSNPANVVGEKDIEPLEKSWSVASIAGDYLASPKKTLDW